MTGRLGVRRALTIEDVAVDAFVYVGVAIAFVITLYPFVFVLSMSISDPVAVVRREIFLLPKGFSLDAYRTVLNDPVVLRSYYNTIWYTGVGTALNLVFTVMAAYPLSKRNFSARRVLMFLFVFTMFFSGGLIPLFVLVVKLGLYATRWAIVIPTLIATFNLIICRTFFQTLPEDLFECARIEGAGEWRIVWKIVVPLSRPIIAVLVLFYGVNHWNSFFPALLYLPKAELQPIQIYLRRVLIQASPEAVQQFETGEQGEGVMAMVQIKFAVMIVAVLPILLLYPFLQRYFVKGVLIGALKG
ncbi:MAG: carbohydrate ABC transporter permease [Spirochaetaceae bacterium]|nr:carbohydrate ABC transporter permease [Spirochaetaceae bacterium]